IILSVVSVPDVRAGNSGPPQPEFRTFAPAGKTDLVDPFTGDFHYEIKLFDVPGPNGSYPVNLSYRSGIPMDREAPWVGAGFTLNPGAIVREVRGLPDDLEGDEMWDTRDIEANQTFGFGLDVNFEIFGADTAVGTGINLGFKGYYNTYRGMGYTRTVG